MRREFIAIARAYWGLALAGMLGLGLCACGGYSTPATTAAAATTSASFLILSSATSGSLPDAVAGSPYSYGFQTNVGQPGVSAVLPITFKSTRALPPGLILSSAGVLSGTPSQPGNYPLTIEAVDSSPTPQASLFSYLMAVRAPGANLSAVAHDDLGGRGQNADVTVATATATQVPYAYIGTRGSPGDCPATGVKVVNLASITSPALVATVGGVTGASQAEAKVISNVASPGFHAGSHGDLMAVTEQPCDPRSITANQTGVEFYDVSDPTHPTLLGVWNSGVEGVSDVAFLPVPGPANSLGIVDHTQDKIYALAAVPNSESNGGTEGDLRVLDVTDPTKVDEVGNWGVLAATTTELQQAVQGYDPRVFLDTIELSGDRKTAYLGYWDEGVVVLDVSDPLAIRSGNTNVLLDHILYPITAVATSTTPTSPEGNTHEALPVAGDTELLVADQVCASAMTPNPSNPAVNVATNPAVAVVCGAGTAVPLSNDNGWGFLRTYALPTPGSATLQSFFVTPESVSDPAPDRGIYTAHNLAWNGDPVHPHAYVAWYSSGVVDLDVTSINPPTRLASFVPPDTPDPNGTNPLVDNPAKAMVYGVAAYSVQGKPYILATDINSGLWILSETPTSQLTILTTSLPDANVGIPYNATITAVNGTLGNDKISYSLASGSNALPSGITLDGSGNLTGTPTVAGAAVAITFSATDDAGVSTLQTINMTVNQNLAVVPPTTVPLGTAGEPYTLTLTGVNGTSPYTWAVVHSALPTGMSLASTAATTAQISGTPPNTGTTTTVLQITDSSAPALTATFPLTITVSKLQVQDTALADASVGVAYTATMVIANGTGPFVPVVVDGTVPPGLAIQAGVLNNLGFVVTGTPTAAGVYNFTVLDTDANGEQLTQTYTMVVNPFEITPPVLPAGVEGRGYVQALTAQGGAPPYLFHVVLGSLPAGLSLSTDGTLTGVPASGTAGTYNFSVLATDTNNLSTTQAFALTVFNGNTFAITTTGLPPAPAGQPFQQAISADFGATPYTFSLLTGTLPAGVTLIPDGTLAGVPGSAAAGQYSFTVQATDANGAKATAHFIWTILPAVSAH